MTARRAKPIFLEALERPDDERVAFVADACGDDASLRREVEALLAAHEMAGDVFADPTGPVSELTGLPEEGPGSTIGPYRLLSPLGEGGFGVVFLAEQDKPVRRQVALKIVKLGMDTKQVLARFQAERQALAMMDHPGIARVLDVGATERGRPYFVMELVRGLPVTEYCDKQNLSIGQRLEVFIEICLAVHHAHQKGIIHRDIKPRNVLVTIQDDRPVPKVIDFGIAKALHQRLTEHTLHTEHGQIVGTPAYMSPEQAEKSGLDVDTRTDIYSLGVLLYELLAGTTPFDKTRLRSANIAEMQRIILEEDPGKPSTKVMETTGSTEASASDVARRRRMDPTHLAHALRGDLDWIVMKALEKDRTRRFESAYAFAEDVRRHLDDEPVLASPPSVTYRLGKFARRHRATVAAAALMAIALLVGVAGAVWGLVESQVAAARATSVNAFMRDILTSVTPGQDGADVRLLDVMDRAARTVGERFADDPLQEAEARLLLADVFRSQGMYRSARAQLEPALAIQREYLGEDDPRTIGAEYTLVFCIGHSGTIGEIEAAVTDFLPRVERVLGPGHRNTLDTRRLAAMTVYRRGQYREAEAAYRAVLADAEAALGPDDIITINAATGIASSLSSRIRSSDITDTESARDEQEAILREIVDRRTRSGAGYTVPTLGTMRQLADLLAERHRYDEARALVEEALGRAEQSLDESHWVRTGLMRVLAQLYERDGNPRAVDLATRLIELRRASLGDEDISVITLKSDLLPIVVDSGRYAEGETIARTLIETLKKFGGGGSHSTDTFEIQHARCLIGLDRLEDADAVLDAMVSRGDGVSYHDRIVLALALADRAEATGDIDAALTHQRHAIELREGLTSESVHMYPEVMQRRLEALGGG